MSSYFEENIFSSTTYTTEPFAHASLGSNGGAMQAYGADLSLQSSSRNSGYGNYSLTSSSDLNSSNSSGHASSTETVNQIAADLLSLRQNSRNKGVSRRLAVGSRLSNIEEVLSPFSAQSNQSTRSTHSTHSLNSVHPVHSAHVAHYAQTAHLSNIEEAILRSTAPIDINESEEISVNFAGQQERGIWANRSEINGWKGEIPISQYVLNKDLVPEVITKRSEQHLLYIQELAIRYLRPPTPPTPGEIIIKQEINTVAPPAPPLVIRQQPARPDTPETLVIREAPPEPPVAVGRKQITISGKKIPPPPRKVVIERLATLPGKPQSILIERWLPYIQNKRRVIFQAAAQRDAVVSKPRNVIVQWESPQIDIKKEFKYLGVIRANPVEYVSRYGSTLKHARDLPGFVLDIKTPQGLVLAADYHHNSVYELEGDVKALQLVDLDREGLSEYRSYLEKLGISSLAGSSSQFFSNENNAGYSNGFQSSRIQSSGFHSSASSSFLSNKQSAQDIVADIFESIDRDRNGNISIDEAARVFLRLNSRLGRQYGEDESRTFFRALDVDRNDQLSLDEFRRAFERLI